MSEEDFDYIGTGGFLLECQGGACLGVTKQQAEIVQEHCLFFQKCLAQYNDKSNDTTDDDDTNTSMGMKESSTRLIQKPDWTLAMARHLVECVTKGKTTISNLDLYQQFMTACDQALLDVRLCSMVNYMDACQCSPTRFLELVQPSMFRFQLCANVPSDTWMDLLDQHGILLYREETNYVVQLYKGDQTVKTRYEMAAKTKLDTKVSDYLVHADRTISALMVIAECLSTPQDLNNRHGDEQFSIYFETQTPIPHDHSELIDRLAGGEAYIRTCGDGHQNVTEGYTVRASLDVLSRAIGPLAKNSPAILSKISPPVTPNGSNKGQARDAQGGSPSTCKDDTEHGGDDAPTNSEVNTEKVDSSQKELLSSTSCCSLRVDHPTPDTLGRLINACQQAIDYPGTIGLDASQGRYFCKKSMRDIAIMLSYLADYSTTAQVVAGHSRRAGGGNLPNVTVYELSSEDNVF